MDDIVVSEDLEAFSAAPGTPVPLLPLQDSNNDDLNRLTVDQDSAFLSKSCYQRQSDDNKLSFHWCLNYTHDVFRDYGDKRQLNKRCRFVKDLVVKSEMFDNDDPDVVFTLRDSEQDSISESSLASTKGLLAFLFVYTQQSCRNETMVDKMTQWLLKICDRAVSSELGPHLHAQGNEALFVLAMNGVMPDLPVDAFGCVGVNLLESVKRYEGRCREAFAKMWQELHEADILTAPLDSRPEPLLRDVLMFGLKALKFRRQNKKDSWAKRGPILTLLQSLCRAVVTLLSQRLEVFVACVYCPAHNTERVAPARSWKYDDKEVSGKTQRVTMTVEAIWETLQSGINYQVSAHDSVRMQQNSAITDSGGATDKMVNYWHRKATALYESQLNLSLVGAYQFNVVSDASTHAGGKNVLLSIIWSRENQTAAFASLQVILPGKHLAREEMNLTSLVEALAQDCHCSVQGYYM